MHIGLAVLPTCRVDSETKDEWLNDLRETPEYVLVNARMQHAHLDHGQASRQIDAASTNVDGAGHLGILISRLRHRVELLTPYESRASCREEICAAESTPGIPRYQPISQPESFNALQGLESRTRPKAVLISPRNHTQFEVATRG